MGTVQGSQDAGWLKVHKVQQVNKVKSPKGDTGAQVAKDQRVPKGDQGEPRVQSPQD